MLREGSPWLGGRPREEAWRGALERSRRVPDERWGNRNRIVLRHLLFGGRLPRVLGFDRGPFEIAGGRATPHQGQIFRSGGRETTFVAAFRMVTDLAEPWIEAVAAGGISDRRFSRGYAAGVRDWLAGRYGRIGSG